MLTERGLDSDIRPVLSDGTPVDDLIDLERREVGMRSRWDRGAPDLVSAERHDVIRRSDAGLRLARRDRYVDQSTLGTSNLAIFL